VVFHLGGVPALYTPYLLWPAMRDRASGFLTPGLGYNSNRGGYFGLSYFWAVDRSWDATFSGDLYTKGYYGLGAEVRGQPSAGTRFGGTYYTVYDPTVARWRWQTGGALVSDDIAPNLRGVVKWLDFSDVSFFEDFNRNFNLVSARSVKSEAFLTWSPDPFALNLRLDREQVLGLGLADDGSVITERRPVLEARMRPTAFFGQRVFLDVAAQAGILRASRGAFQPSGTYDREDFFPKVSIPLSPVPWLSVQADVSGRLTTYGQSLSSGQLHLVDTRYTRELFSAGAQASGPSFSRIFDVSWGPWTRVKHVIEPRLDYQYLSDPGDLSRTPLFDEIDVISSQNVLRYGLVQRLIAKGKQGGSREIASLEISRPYYFKLPGEGTPGGPSPTLTKNAPVDAILRVNATSTLNFDARATYDTHFGQLTAASLTANVAGKDWSAALSVFDSKPVSPPPLPDVPASAQLRFGVGAYILPKRLRLDVLGNYDLTRGRMLESRWLLTVEAACFKILMEYRDLRIGTAPSRDYRLALILKNIGNFLDFTGSLP
jgi:LPS-assembly protein